MLMECFCAKPRSVRCKIVLLDEQELIHELQDTQNGQSILDVVIRHLNLLETAYFGLRYLDLNGQTHWLDPTKKINKQLKGPDPYTLYFGVKFYAVDPCKLLEEITRYQFFLQVKQDILQGRLPVPFELAAELGAFILQSELGDYDSRRHSSGYVSEFRFLSNQSVELETRIGELHRTLIGQLPSVAELNYLDKVKWLEMYGVDLHPVLGEDNMEYFLGLTPSGITVLRNKNTVGNYYWPRISKIYFKGRYFMLRVVDKNNDENTYGFETPSKPACKHLWKCCVEHHAFFRLVQVTPTTPDIFALGSRFRYSGRTEKQAVKDVQMKMRTPPTFSRTPSRRYQRRIVEGGNSECSQVGDSLVSQQYQSHGIKNISVPQPAQNYESLCRTPSSNQIKRSDSPRSTRSAPWSQPHSKGLYDNSVPPSPRSVRSASHHRFRSSSVDSQSSTDSRNYKRRKHRSRVSDNESELSKSSRRSHRKHRRHRSKGKRRDTSHDRKSNSSVKRADSQYELVDSGLQWQEVQRKLSGNNTNNIQQANVVSSKRSGSSQPGETESEISYRNKHRRHRKHRSRSKSPGDSKTWLSDELRKHLAFDLIDTAGMSESQLREIPYTVVKSSTSKVKHLQRNKLENPQNDNKPPSEPPLPYSPQVSDASRIRGMRVNSHSQTQLAHYNGLDQQHHNNSAMLPRALDNLGISDYPNNNYHSNSGHHQYINSHQHHSSHSPHYNGSSGLKYYKPPSTPALYLGNHSHNLHSSNFPNSMHNGFHHQDISEYPRINHEHSDSGLGVDQECVYNSDRLSDNAKINRLISPSSGSNSAVFQPIPNINMNRPHPTDYDTRIHENNNTHHNDINTNNKSDNKKKDHSEMSTEL